MITEKMVSDFSIISGDFNPLHMDENYAAKTKFKKRVCHGMLLSSFLSRLIGMYLPGKNALYFSQTVNFVSPAFINDSITVKGEIIDKSDATKIITVKTSIMNQKNELLLNGESKVMVMNN
jgi:acyl dehydratase